MTNSNNYLWQTFVQRAPNLLMLLAIAVAYGAGLLDFMDHKFSDIRFRILDRAATQEVLLVEIDAQSLRELDVWPWPRSYHAIVADNLREAGARRIVFDVDFSSHSDPREDAVFEQALANWKGQAVLPVFAQIAQQTEVVLAVPVPEFSRHVNVASANVMPDSDGQVRQMAHAEVWGKGYMPTLFAALSDTGIKSTERFHIDYGIRPETISRISYADILLGRFDPSIIAGRSILIGATALELGDILAVPVYKALPGSVIQLLAYESATQGRALTRISKGTILGATFVILAFLGPLLFAALWRRGLVLLVCLALTVFLLSLAIQAVFPLILDIVPLLIAMVCSYAISLVGHINRQDFRLVAQSLVMRRRDAFMRQVLDNSVVGVLVLDQELVVRDCNQAAEDILGIRLDQVAGQPFQQIAAQENPQGGGSQISEILQTRGGAQELVFDAADGKQKYFEVNVADTRVDDELNVVVSFRDVTTEKQAKVEAETAQLHLLAAVESIHEGFALYDSADRLVLSNSRFRRMLLGDPEILPQGTTFQQVMKASAQKGHLVPVPNDPAGGLAFRMEQHQRRKGHYEEILGNGTCLQVSERETFDKGTVAIYHDVTELKDRESRLKQAVENESFANRCKTEFLGNMSHELRTPLNAVIGFSEIIANEIKGPVGVPEYKAYATDILESGQHLLELINDILDVSKIEAGKYNMTETEVDVPGIVQACLKMLKVRIDEAGLKLLVDVPNDLPPLLGSPRAMKQVILNLLSNSVKFNRKNGSISIEAELADDGRFVVRVIDTGIGMTKAEIPTALSVFGQVESQLARKFEGTGLGLPLARRLTELHGGQFQLESERGVGTMATLVFPRDRVLPHPDVPA